MHSVILIGSGGHARVLLDSLDHNFNSIVGYVDVNENVDSLGSIKYLGSDEVINSFPPSKFKLLNGVGSIPYSAKRACIFQKYSSLGFNFVKVVHPSSYVASSVVLNEGCQVMAGAVVQTGSVCGPNVIVNTRASVDHDCHLSACCHVSVGVTLGGNVYVGEGGFVGAGSTVIQGIKLGAKCLIAAGSVVTQDVPAGARVAGVPAKVF